MPNIIPGVECQRNVGVLVEISVSQLVDKSRISILVIVAEIQHLESSTFYTFISGPHQEYMIMII